MVDEQIVVSIHLYQSGQLRAFADVTLLTTLGEVTIRGFRVVQKAEDQPPWIALPATSYKKNGDTKFKDLLDMSQATRRKLAEAILAKYRRVSESSSELPVRP